MNKLKNYHHEKNTNLAYLVIIFSIYLFVIYRILQNLRYQYLWFDEGVQFWISKGLSPLGGPLLPAGSIADVIEKNKYYNLDPGGFGIILHFWSMISDHVIWLRLLPCIFFSGVVLSFIYLSKLKLNNSKVALVMGFVPILAPTILDMGFEIRAYSMETLGAVLCIVAAEKIKNKISSKNLFIWSCIIAVFLTSRYSLIIVAFVTSLYIFYLISRSKNTLQKKFALSLFYSLPLAIALLYIYFFVLKFQNPNIEPLPYLQYLSKDPFILFRGHNVIYLSGLVICLFLLFVQQKFKNIGTYQPLLFITVFTNVLFIVLSLLGKHPWDPSSNRCISMEILMLVSLSAFLGEFINYQFIFKWVGNLYLLSFAVSCIIFIFKNNLNTRYGHTIAIDFKKINIGDYKKIYVDVWETPYIRYLFEYGKLKSEIGKSYPGQFTLEINKQPFNTSGKKKMTDDWKSSLPHMNNLTQYDLLITPLLNRQGDNDKWILMDNTSDFWLKRN